ncbi:MAG TPA: hypothetical protein IGS37_10410 [Synechococcales cyanobacterium M55_K2018_004]|nr:hypothetical protein [Synechococcales cyanobacterium M55_K2018_004]
MRQVGRSLLRWLSGDSEPRVWQTCDRQGHTIWHLYDPATQGKTQFGSEAEVRAWLEQRYYHS